MTIRIYLRCSTDDQNVKSQRHELEKWARGQDEPIDWYSDEGYSGLNLDRPAWRKLVEELQPGDRLVCYAIDRIARDLLHFLSVIQELKAKRVIFHSLREAVDISTPFGEATLPRFCHEQGVLASRMWIPSTRSRTVDVM